MRNALSRALAAELGFDYLGKDELKEALMDVLGAPADITESRRIGRAATVALLRVAQGCPAAVIDSTWFDYSLPLVRQLGGPFVEVRCVVPLDVARQRYGDRVRDLRHLDGLREEAELWGESVAPLGVGPLIEVDTSGPVDVGALAASVRGELTRLAAARTEGA